MISPNKQLTETARDIIHTLLYFDLFSYPITLSEIQQCSSLPNISQAKIESEIQTLMDVGCVFRFDNYYSVRNQKMLVGTRRVGNSLAIKYMKRARKISRFIGNFPFVRSVSLSGSLSKEYMKEDSDIDYFIITEPGRLWIARTMLILFKKIFLLNSHKYFCVNYFIDTDHMEIEEKNRFTATELAFLIPTYGKDVFHLFYHSNQWFRNYLPNFPPRDTLSVPESKSRGIKKLLELILSSKLGEKLDQYFMKKTLSFWQQKFRELSPEEYDIALKSRTYVSKHHPQNFQLQVLSKHAECIREFEEKHQLTPTL